MSFLNFNKKKHKISLLFEVRGDVVSSSIIKTHPLNKPEIIYSKKRIVAIREKIDSKKYTKIILKELDKLVEETYKVGILKILNGNNDISDVHVVLSSPWVLSQSKDIKIKKDKTFEINQDLLSKVISEEECHLSSPTGLNLEENNNIKIIEEKIIQSKLNGYKVNSIFHKKTKDLELNLFLSVSNNYFIEDIKKIISKTFIQKPVFFHSFMLLAFSMVRDIMPHNNNFVFIEMGAEITDVCLVNDDTVYKIYTYPSGKNNIVRKVAEKTNNTYDTALALINMRCNGKCEEKAVEENEKAFDESVSEWTDGLYKIFTSLTSRGGISRDIFLFIDDDLVNLIGKKIKANKLKSFNMINNDFNINFINDNKLNNLVNKENYLKNDSSLKICSAFLNKLRN
jgi:hypothetical protein